jgi:tetratricopeptide (TPR) repeat protein
MSALLFAVLKKSAALLFLIIALGSTSLGSNAVQTFDQANKLYEQGKFADAASAYREVLNSGAKSAAAYFNLGNACFKAGEIGRAIAAYRQAERILPRDPDIRANLQFAKNQVQGPTLRLQWWEKALRRLTLNEWTLLAAASIWLLVLLLALMQWRKALKGPLRSYAIALAAAAIFLCGCLGAAWRQERRAQIAVVIARDASVRQGPLDESQAVFTLHDGAEVRALDAKEEWLQVTPDSRRSGWVKKDQVALTNLKGP